MQAHQDRSGVFAVSDTAPSMSSQDPKESSRAQAAESEEEDDADEAPDSSSAGLQRQPASSAFPSKAGTLP